MIEPLPEEYLGRYNIMMNSGGGTERIFMSDMTLKEANEMCDSLEWHWTDENCFDWYLIIEEI